jgi:hypothetical protein
VTLEERIDQRTLVTAGRAVTGAQIAGASMPAIRAGRIGAISAFCGSAEARTAQRVAVEDRHRWS